MNVSRRAYGRHLVFPLHASIQERCRRIGFDNLAPIIWYKIANAQYEMGPGGYFGKPFEPNGVIKNDIEYILFQRKPGGYRKPDLATRLLSVIPSNDHSDWFQQVWTLGGASTASHPAPFPADARRAAGPDVLVRRGTPSSIPSWVRALPPRLRQRGAGTAFPVRSTRSTSPCRSNG